MNIERRKFNVTYATAKWMEAVALQVVARGHDAGASRQDIVAALDGQGFKINQHYSAQHLGRVLSMMIDNGKATAVGVRAARRFCLAGALDQKAIDAAMLSRPTIKAPAVVPDVLYMHIVR